MPCRANTAARRARFTARTRPEIRKYIDERPRLTARRELYDGQIALSATAPARPLADRAI